MIYHPKPQLGTPYIPGHQLGPAGGLVAHYLFNTPRSDMLYDRTNNCLHGTLTSMDPATDWIVGEMGTALDFDGGDDHIIINAGTLAVPWTVHCIVKRMGDKAAAAIIGAVGTSHGLRLEQWKDTHKVGLTSGGGDQFWEYVTPIGTWVTLTVVVAADMKLYVNGSYHSAIVGSRSIPFDLIARSEFAGEPTMHMALLNAYERALSASEVAWLYRDPYCMFEPRKPAWWWDAMAAPPVVGTPFYYNYLNRLWGETA